MELIIGRAPSISFMRPFGCPVTILNTLDPLGKFDGKAEEGFLVGYSVNSKAFRVFNSQTRKVEENLHGIKLTKKQGPQIANGITDDGSRGRRLQSNQDAVLLERLEASSCWDHQSRPSFVPFGGSFPIDVANLPHDPLMPELEDTAEIQSTGIFGNAYDDHDLETLNTPYADQSVGVIIGFASCMIFPVYLMDVKSALLFGTIEKMYSLPTSRTKIHVDNEVLFVLSESCLSF
ncbi:hypothetical protein Tco_0052659 [Tanacetum coccineum]